MSLKNLSTSLLFFVNSHVMTLLSNSLLLWLLSEKNTPFGFILVFFSFSCRTFTITEAMNARTRCSPERLLCLSAQRQHLRVVLAYVKHLLYLLPCIVFWKNITDLYRPWWIKHEQPLLHPYPVKILRCVSMLLCIVEDLCWFDVPRIMIAYFHVCYILLPLEAT